jgi:hypothetical protein
MDPVQKIWMYEGWLADQREAFEQAKNHACTIGSFWNPEAAQKLMGIDDNTHISTEDDFEESLNIVKEGRIPNMPIVSKRKRRKIKG